METDYSVVILETMIEEISGRGAAIGAGIGGLGMGGIALVSALVKNYLIIKNLKDKKTDCEDDDCRNWTDDQIDRQKKLFIKSWKKVVAAGIAGAAGGAAVGSGSIEQGYSWVRGLINGRLNLPKMLNLPQHLFMYKK